MRISRHQMFMEIAEVAARRSTCCRLNVGAVVVHNNRPVSLGYNGSAPGDRHCQGNNCPGKKGPCTLTIHAEVNALRHLPAGVHGLDLELYVTDSPCGHCAAFIALFPVKEVYFRVPYRDTHGIDLLIHQGVKIYQVTPAGYVMDWETKEIIDDKVYLRP